MFMNIIIIIAGQAVSIVVPDWYVIVALVHLIQQTEKQQIIIWYNLRSYLYIYR